MNVPIIVYGDSFSEDSPRTRKQKAIELVNVALREEPIRGEDLFRDEEPTGELLAGTTAESMVPVKGSALTIDAMIEAARAFTDSAIRAFGEAMPCECEVCCSIRFARYVRQQQEGKRLLLPSQQAKASLEWSRQLREKIAASDEAARERERLQVVVDYDDF